MYTACIESHVQYPGACGLCYRTGGLFPLFDQWANESFLENILVNSNYRRTDRDEIIVLRLILN